MKTFRPAIALVLVSTFLSLPLHAQNAGPNSEASPPADKVPLGGQANPTKHDGTDLGTTEGMTPHDGDTKGAQLNTGSFLKEAALSNMAELKASTFASTHASDPRVKEMATHMVADHQRMATAASQIAKQKGVVLPTKLDASRAATDKRLEKMTGAAFDKAYVAQMVKDHQDTVSYFERMEKETTDADVKAFVTAQLPVLRQHSEMVLALNDVEKPKK